MHRFYHSIVQEHLLENHEMLLLMGPRQVGKTTTCKGLMTDWKHAFYFNWDNFRDRQSVMQGPDHIGEMTGLLAPTADPVLLIFDEIHKFAGWKLFLKGLYDTYADRSRIVVTGSARLDVYQKGGDSLMGRYLRYRFHPLTVGEILRPSSRETEYAPPTELDPEVFEALLRFSGFPAPFLKRSQRYANQWRMLRLQQIVQEDIRDLTRIHELGQLERVMELLRGQIGQLLNYSSLALKAGVSHHTIRSWLETLKSLYYCYTITPWSRNSSRSLTKNPKPYLWDWTLCQDEGARAENFVASHLLKACDFWTDHGLGHYQLYFLRDKEQREVDFLVTKGKQPWFLVEVKCSNNKALSKDLYHYQKLTNAPHAFQVVLNLPYEEIDCFAYREPVIVPAISFLSQLV